MTEGAANCPNPMKLIIASNLYNSEINPEHINSLMDLTVILNEMQIPYEYWAGEEKDDAKSKNRVINKFLNTDFTHLLMVKSELSWDIRGVIRLLKAAIKGAEVIGGTYPMYGNFGAIPEMEDGMVVGYDTNEFRIIKCKQLAGGFILYNKTAFDKVETETYIEKNMQDEDIHIKEYFKTISFPGTEDIYFQRKYIEAGGEILLEPNITFKFLGKKKWNGNYSQYLLGNPVI